MSKLSDKQLRFVHEYLIDQNASAAAVRAGYSEKTKGTQAVELMKNPLVKARILEELSGIYAQLKVTALDILRAQVAAAYFDPACLFNEAREPVPLHTLGAQALSALTVSYDQRRNGEFVMRVRQTPRHVAVAALQRRQEQFEKLKLGFAHAQMLAQVEIERIAARPAQGRPVVLDIEACEARLRAGPQQTAADWEWRVAPARGDAHGVEQAQGHGPAHEQAVMQAQARAAALGALSGAPGVPVVADAALAVDAALDAEVAMGAEGGGAQAQVSLAAQGAIDWDAIEREIDIEMEAHAGLEEGEGEAEAEAREEAHEEAYEKAYEKADEKADEDGPVPELHPQVQVQVQEKAEADAQRDAAQASTAPAEAAQADADVGAGAGADAGAGAGADADADADANMGAGANRRADAGADAQVEADTDADADTGTDTDTDTESNTPSGMTQAHDLSGDRRGMHAGIQARVMARVQKVAAALLARREATPVQSAASFENAASAAPLQYAASAAPLQYAASAAKAAAAALKAGAMQRLTGAPKPYHFREDPHWMWGGAYRRNPVPPQELPTPGQIAQAVAAARLRPRQVIRPGGLPPGFNPPPARDPRPQFAIGAGEFHWS